MKRLFLALLFAAAAMAGANWLYSRVITPGLESGPPPAPIAPRFASQDFNASIALSDESISRLSGAGKNGDWLDLETLSSAYLGRARLSGSYKDIVAADDAADRGVKMAVKGSGPLLARAAALLTAHRLDAAAIDLDAVDRFVVPDITTRADAKAMRADIAQSRGDYAGAAALLDMAGRLQSWPGLTYRRAILAGQLGKIDEARALFIETDGLNRMPTPAFRADRLTRIAELDLAQGKWPEATKGFAEANRIFPGYWRTEMRVAQMQALRGRLAQAITEFARIAAVNDAPEPMDILAGLYRAEGNAPASKAWAAKAAILWQARLKQLPEAAWAHAAEHELAFGDPRTALDLAGKNARNRPNGAALILLAKAWIANQRADHALALCSKIEQSGWVSTELWLTKAEALSLLGRGDEAQAAQAQAQKLNSHALERTPAFGWLDH
jgi:hypothetical protein